MRNFNVSGGSLRFLPVLLGVLLAAPAAAQTTLGDGANRISTSSDLPQAPKVQTSVHGCDGPVADVTRVSRTCTSLHLAGARPMVAAMAP